MIPVFNTQLEAQRYVAAHPGSQVAYLASVTYDPTAPLFATPGEVITYLIENLGATASWNQPPLYSAASIIYPGPPLALFQLAADLTTLRAAIANQQTFVGITAQQTAQIQADLSACIIDLNGLVQQTEIVMSSASGVANVISGGVDYLLVQDFETFSSYAEYLPDLIDMESFLLRMQANLMVVTAAVAPSTVPAGPSEFTLGQSVLGGPDVLGA